VRSSTASSVVALRISRENACVLLFEAIFVIDTMCSDHNRWAGRGWTYVMRSLHEGYAYLVDMNMWTND
jgi:hypothetical protein